MPVPIRGCSSAWQSTCMACRGSGVQIPSAPPTKSLARQGISPVLGVLPNQPKAANPTPAPRTALPCGCRMGRGFKSPQLHQVCWLFTEVRAHLGSKSSLMPNRKGAGAAFTPPQRSSLPTRVSCCSHSAPYHGTVSPGRASETRGTIKPRSLWWYDQTPRSTYWVESKGDR